MLARVSDGGSGTYFMCICSICSVSRMIQCYFDGCKARKYETIDTVGDFFFFFCRYFQL